MWVTEKNKEMFNQDTLCVQAKFRNGHDPNKNFKKAIP